MSKVTGGHPQPVKRAAAAQAPEARKKPIAQVQRLPA